MNSHNQIESWEVRVTTGKTVDVLCEINAVKELLSEEYTERDLLQKLLKVQDMLNLITYDVNSYVRKTTEVMANALKEAVADNNTLVAQCANWQKKSEYSNLVLKDIKCALGEEHYSQIIGDGPEEDFMDEQPF